MKNPIQPLAKDGQGVTRFKPNAIVRHLLDSHPSCDMNALTQMDFTDDDREQFAQLIGYSLSGYGDLSYVSNESFEVAFAIAEKGLSEKDAMIATLQEELASLRAALREPMAKLYRVHPDELRS